MLLCIAMCIAGHESVVRRCPLSRRYTTYGLCDNAPDRHDKVRETLGLDLTTATSPEVLKEGSSHAIADLDLHTSTLCSAVANILYLPTLQVGATVNLNMKATFLKRLAQMANGDPIKTAEQGFILVAALTMNRNHMIGAGNQRLTPRFVKVGACDVQFSIAPRLNSLKGVKGKVGISDSVGYF